MDLGMPMTDAVEPPELAGRNLYVVARIWSAAQGFFFLSFLFAFFYLRALNSNRVWRGWPGHHPKPSLAFGIAILVCVLASVAAAHSGRAAPETWKIGGAVSLVLGLAAVGLQAAQFSSLGFGPTDGGYASVFVGWTGLYALSVLGTMYWLATLIAEQWRGFPVEPLYGAAVEAFRFTWGTLALVGVAAFILLYVVA